MPGEHEEQPERKPAKAAKPTGNKSERVNEDAFMVCEEDGD